MHDWTSAADLMKERLVFTKEGPGMLGKGSHVGAREAEGSPLLSLLLQVSTSSHRSFIRVKQKISSSCYAQQSYFPLRG